MRLIRSLQAHKKLIIITGVFLAWTMLSAYAGTRHQIRVYNQQEQKSKALIPDTKKISVSSGQVTSLSTEKLTIKDLQAKTRSYTLASTTSYIQNGKAATVKDIQQGDTVRIIPEQSDPTIARQILIVVN